MTDYSKGFGGKFGVEKDRQDKSAAGWVKEEESEDTNKDVEKVGRTVGKLNLDMWNKQPVETSAEKVPKPKENLKKSLPQTIEVLFINFVTFDFFFDFLH